MTAHSAKRKGMSHDLRMCLMLVGYGLLGGGTAAFCNKLYGTTYTWADAGFLLVASFVALLVVALRGERRV